MYVQAAVQICSVCIETSVFVSVEGGWDFPLAFMSSAASLIVAGSRLLVNLARCVFVFSHLWGLRLCPVLCHPNRECPGRWFKLCLHSDASKEWWTKSLMVINDFYELKCFVFFVSPCNSHSCTSFISQSCFLFMYFAQPPDSGGADAANRKSIKTCTTCRLHYIVTVFKQNE